MEKNTAIIFDMDDTLYKERDYRLSGFRTVARHFASACGLSPARLYDLMLKEPDIAFENIHDLAATRGLNVPVDLQIAVYRTHYPDIELDSETKHTLTELRNRGYRLGAITDGRMFGQLNKISALQLEAFLDPDLIVPTVLYNTDKHSRRPFEMVEDLLPKGTRLVYVGDNPEKDFRHPNAMAWHTIMLVDVDHINRHHQDLRKFDDEYLPQSTVNNISDLLKIFK